LYGLKSVADSALGRLVASVILDTAEWTTGSDKAKYIAAQTASSIDKSFKDLERDVKGTLGGIVAAFAAGFGVAALKSTFDSYAEGAAKLEDLALKAGTTVEIMSGLSPIAKLAGASLDDVATAAAKLSKGLVNSSNETKGAGKALAFLGIDAKDASGNLKDSGTLMEEIALKLSTYGDGIAKTTIAQDLFGKSGANLLPFLKDLAEYGIQDAKITAQQAALAKDYEQNLVRLGIAKSALGKIISKEVLPVADAFVKTLLETITQTGGLRDKTKELADDGSIRDFAMGGVRAFGLILNAGDSVMRIFDAIGEGVGAVLARMGNTLGAIGDAIVHFIRGDYALAWDDLKQGVVRDAAITVDFGNKVRGIFEKPLAGDAFVAGVEKNLAAIDAKLNEHAAAVKRSADPYKALSDAADGASASLIASLEKQLAKVTNLWSEEKKLTEVEIEIEKLRKEGKTVDEQTIRDLARRIDAQVLLNKALKATLDAEEAAVRRYQQDEQAVRSKIDAMVQGNKQYEFETSLLGANNAERAIAILLKDKEKAVDDARRFGLEKETAALYDQKIAMVANRAEMVLQLSVWQQLTDKTGSFFSDLILHGKSAFDSLKQWAKEFLAQMIAIFATRWVLSLAAGALGGGAGDAMASAALNYGSSTLAGQAVNYLGGSTAVASAYGATGLAAGGGYGSSAFLTGLSSGGGGGAVGGTGASGFMSSLGAAGSALGIFAVVVAGLVTSMRLYSSGWGAAGGSAGNGMNSAGWIQGTPIQSPMGGMVGGTYRVLEGLGMSQQWASILSGMTGMARLFGWSAAGRDAYGVSGAVTGTGFTGQNWQDFSQRGGVFRSDRRWTETAAFGSDQQGFFNQLMQSLTGVTQRFADILHVDLHDALSGYTRDFNAQLSDNGNYIGDDKLNQILSDFFGSVLQEQVSKLFNAAGDTRLADWVANLKGTGAEVTAQIQELVGSMEGLAKLNLKGLDIHALMDWEHEGESVGQAFQRVAGQIAQFDSAFSTSGQKIAAVQGVVATGFASLGVSIPKTNQEFYDLVHGLDLSTESGRKTFDALMQLAPAWQGVQSAMAAFDDAFMSSGRKLSAAQETVASTFDRLGIAIPQSSDDFYTLVHSIDTSTEAGRNMVAALLDVAPAFQTVEKAAAAMLANFDQLMGEIRPGYSSQQQGLALSSSVSSFMGANAWTNGMSQQQVVEQVRTITREDFARYSNSNQQLILSILQLDHTINGNTGAIVTATTGPSASTLLGSPDWERRINAEGAGKTPCRRADGLRSANPGDILPLPTSIAILGSSSLGR
jgi:hypothetical protein